MSGHISLFYVYESSTKAEEDIDRQQVNWTKEPEDLQTVNEKRRDRDGYHRDDPYIAEGFMQFPSRFRGEYEGAQRQRETRRKSVDFYCAGCIKDGIDGHWTPRGKLQHLSRLSVSDLRTKMRVLEDLVRE